MGIFSRSNKGGAPKIPSLPEFPGENKPSELPSLPKNFSEDVNRDIIKSAMNELPEPSEEIESNESESMSDNFSKGGFIPSVPVQREQDSLHQHEKFLPRTEAIPSIKREVKAFEGPDSIFVRLDKFRLAKKEISDVKKSIMETEDLLRKINEVKLKEDEEIKDINLSLEDIKRKIGEVDSLVFDKI